MSVNRRSPSAVTVQPGQWLMPWLLGVGISVVGFVLSFSPLIWIGLVFCIGAVALHMFRLVKIVNSRKR